MHQYSTDTSGCKMDLKQLLFKLLWCFHVVSLHNVSLRLLIMWKTYIPVRSILLDKTRVIWCI